MEELKSIWNKKAPATIIGVLIIGIVCSAIYDVFIKPGINSFSSKLFNLVTLGSESIKDYAFSNAALDPTSIPSTILLFMFAGLLAGLFTSKEIIQFIKSRKEKGASSSPSTLRKIFFPAFSLTNTILIFVYITTVNQSVLVWRAFHANLQISAPYMTEKEVLTLKSKFSSMTSKAEYDKIYRELLQAAEKNKVALREIQTW